jgi:hypothetical protein
MAAGVPAPGAPPTSSPPEATRLTIAASGDFLIHTPVAAQALANGGGTRYDFAPMFRPVRRWIRGADLALCHVETPLVPGPPAGYPSFRTPPGLVRAVGVRRPAGAARLVRPHRRGRGTAPLRTGGTPPIDLRCAARARLPGAPGRAESSCVRPFAACGRTRTNASALAGPGVRPSPLRVSSRPRPNPARRRSLGQCDQPRAALWRRSSATSDFWCSAAINSLSGSDPAAISSTARSGSISPARRSSSTCTSSLTSSSSARL